MTKGLEKQVKGIVVEMTQMLLSYISARPYIVILLRMNEHLSLCTPVQSHVCEWRTKPLSGVCVYLYTSV